MQIIEIYTRPNSSDILTKTRHKKQIVYRQHNLFNDDIITLERFVELKEKQNFQFLNAITI